MCGIAGFVTLVPAEGKRKAVKTLLTDLLTHTVMKVYPRGRDSLGFSFGTRQNKDGMFIKHDIRGQDVTQVTTTIQSSLKDYLDCGTSWVLCNVRGIPTTEAVDDLTSRHLMRDEIQPFVQTGPGWFSSIVHNGLVSNDKELYAEYGWDRLMTTPGYRHDIDSYALLQLLNQIQPDAAGHDPDVPLSKINGSYAFAYARSEVGVLFARNYLGLHFYLIRTSGNGLYLFFSSEAFDHHWIHYEGSTAEVKADWQFELPPESALWFSQKRLDKFAKRGAKTAFKMARTQMSNVFEEYGRRVSMSRAVVVFSGGLDSTVAASSLGHDGFEEVHLMHLQYGCKAEEQELEAVESVYHRLQNQYPNTKWVLRIQDMRWLKQMGGSTLTDDSLDVTKGEAGAETISEWVPARNLAMIGVAAAYCDVHDLEFIVLGLNREEASVFNDNSTEFYQQLTKALALGTKSKPTIYCPVGNMMKHHIVSFGESIGAPIRYSWSCYEGGEHRCGECGPCINTQRAFRMAGVEEGRKYVTHEVAKL